MLVALGIVVILLAVAIPSVISVRASLKLTELDATARQMFAAAQNQLTVLRATGELSSLNATAMDFMPSDFPSADGAPAWADGDYRYLTQDGAGALVTTGLPDASDSAPHCIIEYDAVTATVYGVFYAERDFAYDQNTPRADRAARKSIPLGYYGGAAVSEARAGQSPQPAFTVDNGNALSLSVQRAANTAYTISITSDSGAASFAFQDTDQLNVSVRYPGIMSYVTEAGGTASYRILLDDPFGGQPFSKLYAESGFVPGENLRITVTAAQDGLLPSSAQVTVSSLFDRLDGNTAYIACARHLQNLSPAVSQVAADVSAAVQTNDIAWSGQYAAFTPITNPTLHAYDGSGLTISALRVQGAGDLGLFGSFGSANERGTLQNIRLQNPGVAAKNDGDVRSAGALAGQIQNTDVRGCQASLSASDAAFSAFADYGVSGSGSVGGLIGRASGGSSLRKSAASLAKVRAASGVAGGLVGAMSDGEILECYADTGYYDAAAAAWKGGVSAPSAAGLLGDAGSASLQNCYALSLLNGSGQAAGCLLGGEAASAANCYAASLSGEFPAGAAGFADTGDEQDCFYLSGTAAAPRTGVAAKTYAELKRIFTDGVWTQATPDTTQPYGCTESAYPFPRLSALRHFGDWPAQPSDDALGVVYYEKYSDGTYGFFGPKADGTLHDTLNNDNRLTILDTGYGLLLETGDTISSYQAGPSESFWWNGYDDPFETTPVAVTVGSAERRLYPFTQSTTAQIAARLYTQRCTLLAVQRSGQAAWLYAVNPYFGAAVTAWSNAGSLGTQALPLQLRTQGQLRALAYQTGTNTYWKQTRDIPVSGWTSVSPLAWSGVIDGGGCQITGLNQPLFGAIYGGLTVKNVHIERASIYLGGTGTYGILVNSNYGAILNCIAANSAIRAPYGTAAGLVGSADYGGSIRQSYSNCTVTARYAAGFVATSTVGSSDCYALGAVSGTQYAVGFALTVDWGASVVRCYSASTVSASVGNAWGFAPTPYAGQSACVNCYYLEQDDLTSGAGQALRYADLSALQFSGSNWTTADVSRSHPASAALQGKAYPFPLIAALDHYGDWPVNDLKNAELAYFEIYQSGKRYTIGFYSSALGLDTLPGAGETVVQDGYALLFRKSRNGNSSGGININKLPETITCTYTTQQAVKTEKGLILDVNDIPYTLTNLTHNGTVSAGGSNFVPMFLPARVSATDGTNPQNYGFYQPLTVQGTDGAERTFWYNPHFAKSAVSVNQNPNGSGSVSAVIRTQRQFAALASTVTGKPFWGKANYTFTQERDLEFSNAYQGVNPYAANYFGTTLADSYYNRCAPIGSGAAFAATYNGGGFRLNNLGYTASGSGGTGVFARIRGTVKKLTVSNVRVETAGAYAGLGGLAGFVEQRATVQDVTLTSPYVSAGSGSAAGGAIGQLTGGTVTALSVTGARVSGAQLVGGAIGQMLNNTAVTVQGAAVSGNAELTALSTAASSADSAFGVGGFAGACVLSSAGSPIALSNLTVDGAAVLVKNSAARHAGAALIGNLYGSAASAFNLNGAALYNCSLELEGCAAGSSFGMLFGRVQLSSPPTMSALSQSGCTIWSDAALDGSDVGGYIGRVLPGANVSGTQKLVLSLSGGSWSPVTLTGCSGAASLGGFVGSMGENTVLRGGGMTLSAPTVRGGSVVGGFVGSSAGILSDISVVSPTVSGSGAAGGFAGTVTLGELTHCDVRAGSGYVMGGAATGGFVGRLTGSTADISNCFASVYVYGDGNTGGFAGVVESSRVERCYASGAVSGGSGGNTGGFAGLLQRGSGQSTIPLLISCYASGSVNAANELGDTGGFVGCSMAGTLLSDYSVGSVTVGGWRGQYGNTGGFLGYGAGLTSGEAQENEVLSSMATFYNILQTTKVVNRDGSSAVLQSDGSWDTTNCRNVTDYIRSYNDSKPANPLKIDSGVDITKPAARGTWKSGKLVEGAVSWNVVNTMAAYPELKNGVWMAQEERIDGVREIVVYWCAADLSAYQKGDAVPAYRYVNAARSYYTGTMTLDTQTQFGSTYFVLRNPSGFTEPIPMPSTLTINGYYLYNPLARYNYAPEQLPLHSFAYSDYQYDGIARWSAYSFRADAAKSASASDKVFKIMRPAAASAATGAYPYPALPGVGCGYQDDDFIHWGDW